MFLGLLIEAYCLDRDIVLTGVGAWLHKNKCKKGAAEPDESYIFGPFRSKPRADLVIEVAWTSGGIDKLEIYRKLDIDEVWWCAEAESFNEAVKQLRAATKR